MTETAENPRLTFGAALKEVGWLPLVLMGIGGLSIIDILETAVFGDLSLITPLEIVVEGYRRVAALAGALVERPLAPLIGWLSGLINLELTLHPYWRSLFLLQALAVTPIVRSTWDAGEKLDAAIAAIVMYLGCVVAALIVGLAPANPAWWFQGLVAAIMVLTIWLTFGVAAALGPAGRDDKVEVGAGVVFASFCAAVTFAIAAALSFIPQVGAGAAAMAIGVFIAAFGVLFIAVAFRSNEDSVATFRMGLAIFGGFVAAALVLVADAVVKAFG
ncbi:MAG: hypothetical protein AB7H66_13865 [Hyphomonadaceae bacterium]